MTFVDKCFYDLLTLNLVGYYVNVNVMYKIMISRGGEYCSASTTFRWIFLECSKNSRNFSIPTRDPNKNRFTNRLSCRIVHIIVDLIVKPMRSSKNTSDYIIRFHRTIYYNIAVVDFSF